jgi:hypothetical protein
VLPESRTEPVRTGPAGVTPIRHYGKYTPHNEVVGRTNRLISFDTTGTTLKTTPPTILRCRGNVFTEPSLCNDRGLHRQTYRLSLIRHGPHRKRRIKQFFLVSCNRCHENAYTKPLPSNGKGIHIQTDGRDL